MCIHVDYVEKKMYVHVDTNFIITKVDVYQKVWYGLPFTFIEFVLKSTQLQSH